MIFIYCVLLIMSDWLRVIVPYNALLYLALIRPVFCTGAIIKPNLNKVCKKKKEKWLIVLLTVNNFINGK